MDPEYFVKLQQFTPHTYRDIYPAIDPTKQPSLSQKGKVVIITGASQGLGARGFAPAFAATKPKALILAARNLSKLKALAASLSKDHPDIAILSLALDISSPDSISTFYTTIKSNYGHADVLINNAAVNDVEQRLKDADPVRWWSEFEINVRGTFLMTQGFLRLLPSPDTPARIVTLTSGAAVIAFDSVSAYGIAKLALLQMTAFVALENPNVVNVALHPGVIETDMLKEAFRAVALDTPELVGGVGTWLAAWEGADRAFLSGRYVTANWDVEELVGRSEEILKGDLLKVGLSGRFGREQFQ
ncbi:NAD(P)-binding protein [Lophiostoma macrostomum CBS 122681]|uniref:NAD(P)-binding protein n=1 Tax=Lophiostoma macrostomum CBS 122681 TaxID=1314788 RepID=A0A6A6SMQ0_9PLEO|nr:NAD(P)-binding protein [Lophiostoma macrostomum CBS 122681]